MSSSNTSFVGSVPEYYERYLVPVIFAPHAQDLVARIGDRAAGTLLEIACGTGAVARTLLPRLGSGARLVATDLNQAMVDEARRRTPEDPRLTWRTADAMALPFGDAEFDVAFCQFGMMFLPDKLAGFREAKRVLKPGGELLFNVWDNSAHNSFGRIAHVTIASFFPTDPPLFYLAPFSYHDAAAIRAQVLEAGFRDVTIEFIPKQAVSPTARDLATGLVRGNPVIEMIRERGGVEPEVVVEAVADALARDGGAAPFNAPIRALVVRARV